MKKQKYKPTKSKTAAIVIAVLFGVFSWAYTYKFDAWKFWLNLLLAILTLGWWAPVALIWVIIDQAIKPAEFYEEYYNN